MFQNKNLVKALNLGLILLVFHSFSCSQKKASGVRGQVKKNQAVINPTTSTQAQQQAAAADALYKINSISFPNATGSGHTVEVELLTPGNEYLPVTTSHENGNLDSQGIYNDTARGLKVYVQARCSTDDCFKYILLVTVTRNNQSVYQTGALSYSNDCKFNSISVSPNAGQMYQNLSTFEFSLQNIQPVNDIDSCSY